MPAPSRPLLYRIAAAAVDRLERFARAPAPVVTASAPFAGGPQGPGNAPPIDYTADAPRPSSDPLVLRARYSTHTYRATGQPLGLSGFNVARMRAAIETHDTGATFLESSLFAAASTRYAPVHTALAQCIAPGMDLPRYIRGGTKGLARLVAEEVEARLCPSGGALSSIYFPTALWGSLALEVSMMNFAVMQHVDGDPDPETGVRPRFTRRWPVYATTCDMYRKTYQAQTTEGPVDILNDGKFTLIADEDLPHLNSPIRALGAPVMSGLLAQQARDNYINLYGNPKPIGTMPEKVGVDTPEGKLFFQSMDDFRNPGGIILLPNGAEVDFAQLEGRTSSVFIDASEETWKFIAAVMLGSDGTMTKGTGGVYTSPIFADVKRNINGRRLTMIVRGINDGDIRPYVDYNYAAGKAAAKARGIWKDPVLDIPLPDPDEAVRFAEKAKRQRAYSDQLKEDRAAGLVVDKDRNEAMASELGAVAGILAEASSTPVARLDLAPTDIAKVVRVDEARRSQGLPPIGDERGDLTISELDALVKAGPVAPLPPAGEPAKIQDATPPAAPVEGEPKP